MKYREAINSTLTSLIERSSGQLKKLKDDEITEVYIRTGRMHTSPMQAARCVTYRVILWVAHAASGTTGEALNQSDASL